MKRFVALFLAISVVLIGCRSENNTAGPAAQRGDIGVASKGNADPAAHSAPSSKDDVVARVGNVTITIEELQEPLIEGYGLNVLLNLVQLELARDTAQRQGVTVSPADIEAEREKTLARMFKDAPKEDYPALMDQFLAQNRITDPEFDLVIETNACLHKIVEPQMANKITEENVKEAFLQTYGETVKVRHIQTSNLQEIVEAQRRLSTGETFDKIARDMSRNAQTGSLGGELPSFSLSTPGLPQAFKDAAFALQPGQVSDPVQAEGAYHLIKLEQRIPPRAVKYEDHKEIVRADLEDRLMQAAVKELRQQLAQQAVELLEVEHPTLKAQFEARKQQRDAEIKDRQQIRENLERQRQRLATQPAIPTTAPEATPAAPTAPTTQPATTPGA